MSAKNNLKRLFLAIGFFFFSQLWLVQGEAADVFTWQSIESKYTIIRYQTLKDLKKFDKKIDYSPSEWGLKRLFSSGGSDNLIDNVKKKVDALFERVQELLDMRKRMKKVKINIYHNKKQLHLAYNNIYKKKCRIRGWYLYEYNTIYINVCDLDEGMLAHEMAHSVTDRYLLVRPPRVTAEILSRYVDSHLFDLQAPKRYD